MISNFASNSDAPPAWLLAFQSPPELPVLGATLYSSYILPSRRYVPPRAPSSDSTETNHSTGPNCLPPTDTYNVSDLLRRSSYKKLPKFLAAMEKMGFLTLKRLKKDRAGDVLVTKIMYIQLQGSNTHDDDEDNEDSVPNGKTRAVTHGAKDHVDFETVGEVEARGVTSDPEGEPKQPRRLHIKQFWRVDLPPPGTPDPELTPLAVLFRNGSRGAVDAGVPMDGFDGWFYSSEDLEAILDAYIACPRSSGLRARSLVDPRDENYVLLDEVLTQLVWRKEELPPSVQDANRPERRDPFKESWRTKRLRKTQVLGCLKWVEGIEPYYEVRGSDDDDEYIFK